MTGAQQHRRSCRQCGINDALRQFSRWRGILLRGHRARSHAIGNFLIWGIVPQPKLLLLRHTSAVKWPTPEAQLAVRGRAAEKS